MSTLVQVRELAAWGFDDFPYRPTPQPRLYEVATQPSASAVNPLLDDLTAAHATRLATHAKRADLQAEFEGLSWSLAIVDLRHLQAFQRRLSFNHRQLNPLPAQNDWPALIDFALAPPRPIEYQLQKAPDPTRFTLTTSDPNLHLRPSENPATPLIVHGGSPFLEVARYRDRWFLRDGYHRAYALMQRNIFAVPAVIIETGTLTELGANDARFFSEQLLFSPRPPYVADFLNENLTITYDRTALRKTIRLTIEEIFSPDLD
jgi:hypothetical protein